MKKNTLKIQYVGKPSDYLDDQIITFARGLGFEEIEAKYAVQHNIRILLFERKNKAT